MGEVVVILVVPPHKTVKPIGGDFNAEYVRQHKNHQIGLRTQESYILKC